MAKKITGNPLIDQIVAYQEFVKKARYISSLLYFDTPSLVYVKSIFDYERIIITIDPTLIDISSYVKSSIEPTVSYDSLKELKKTRMDACVTENGNILLINNKPEFAEKKVELLTENSLQVMDTKKTLRQMVIETAYSLSDGTNVFEGLINQVVNENLEEYTPMKDKILAEYFENGVVYFNDDTIESDYSSLMISKESFPLLSEKTISLSYKILCIEEEYVDILYRQKEEGYTIYTYIQYMIA